MANIPGPEDYIDVSGLRMIPNRIYKIETDGLNRTREYFILGKRPSKTAPVWYGESLSTPDKFGLPHDRAKDCRRISKESVRNYLIAMTERLNLVENDWSQQEIAEAERGASWEAKLKRAKKR